MFGGNHSVDKDGEDAEIHYWCWCQTISYYFTNHISHAGWLNGFLHVAVMATAAMRCIQNPACATMDDPLVGGGAV